MINKYVISFYTHVCVYIKGGNFIERRIIQEIFYSDKKITSSGYRNTIGTKEKRESGLYVRKCLEQMEVLHLTYW